MAALADWRQEIEPRPGGSESWHTPAGPRRGSWECEEEGDSCGRSGGQGTVLDVPVGGGFPGPLPATPPSPTLPGPPRKRPQVFSGVEQGCCGPLLPSEVSQSFQVRCPKAQAVESN